MSNIEYSSDINLFFALVRQKSVIMYKVATYLYLD